MLNQGWQNAFTASVLALIIMVIIPNACGGEVEQEAAADTEYYIILDGFQYEAECEEAGGL